MNQIKLFLNLDLDLLGRDQLSLVKQPLLISHPKSVKSVDKSGSKCEIIELIRACKKHERELPCPFIQENLTESATHNSIKR